MNLVVPMFVAGLLTSFHCVMMCGNLVLSYAVKGAEEGPLVRRMVPHLAYHGAKILSYMLVGLLLGSIGMFISEQARSWVSVFAGAYMIVLGLIMTGKFPALSVLTPRPPRFIVSALSKLRRRSAAEDSGPHVATPVAFGAMSGLMPCGPLQAAQLAAAGSGSAVAGASMMFAFGLGTMPLMLFYGGAASFLSGKFKARMGVFASIAIIILGLVMIDRGATALGSPLNFNAVRTAVVRPRAGRGDRRDRARRRRRRGDPAGHREHGLRPRRDRAAGERGGPHRRGPPRGRRVLRRAVDPAARRSAEAEPNGTTVVEVPASAAGTYQMTCQMGMMSGTVIVGAGGGNAARTAPLFWIFGIGAAVGGGVWLYRRNTSKPAKPAKATDKPKTENDEKADFTQIVLVALAVLLAALAGLVLGGFFQ